MAESPKRFSFRRDVLPQCFIRKRLRPSGGQARASSCPARPRSESREDTEEQSTALLDDDSPELRTQVSTLLRESVEQTVARLSTARRNNFNHSEAGLRLAVADANRLLTDSDASTEHLLSCLAAIESEAQLLSLPTDVEAVASDLERLRVVLRRLQQEADGGRRDEATAAEAAEICQRLVELRMRPSTSPELQKLAAEFSLLSSRLESLGVTMADSQSVAALLRGRSSREASPTVGQLRASTFAAVPRSRECSPMASPRTSGGQALASPRGSSGNAFGKTWVGDSGSQSKASAAGPRQRQASPLRDACSSGLKSAEPRSDRRESASPASRPAIVPGPSIGMTKSGLSAEEVQVRPSAGGENAGSSAQVQATSTGKSTGSAAAASPTPWPEGRSVGAQLGLLSSFSPSSMTTETQDRSLTTQSFFLQEWDDDLQVRSMGAEKAEQLNRLSTDAAKLAEAHKEIAHLIEAAAPDLDAVEQHVETTVQNTSEGVQHLAEASRARGWTLKASCPAAVIGTGVGFVVGGPIGAAVVGGAGAAVGAAAGKAAKWRHNRKIDEVLEDQSRLRNRRRLSSQE